MAVMLAAYSFSSLARQSTVIHMPPVVELVIKLTGPVRVARAPGALHSRMATRVRDSPFPPRKHAQRAGSSCLRGEIGLFLVCHARGESMAPGVNIGQNP